MPYFNQCGIFYLSGNGDIFMTGEIIAFFMLQAMTILAVVIREFTHNRKLAMTTASTNADLSRQRDEFVQKMANQSLDLQKQLTTIQVQTAESIGFYKAKVEELEKKLADRKSAVALLETMVTELQKQLKSANEDNTVMRDELKKLTDRVNELEQRIAKLSDELEQERKARQEAERRAEDAERRLREVEAERDELKQMLETVEVKKADA
jgi:chromosome segregation ATPase